MRYYSTVTDHVIISRNGSSVVSDRVIDRVVGHLAYVLEIERNRDDVELLQSSFEHACRLVTEKARESEGGAVWFEESIQILSLLFGSRYTPREIDLIFDLASWLHMKFVVNSTGDVLSYEGTSFTACNLNAGRVVCFVAR